MYLFSPKTSKNGSRKSFIKFIWTASDKLCHLVYIIFPVKIHDSHLTCKVANKFLNVRERVEVVEWNKRWSLPFPCCPVNRQCLWKKTLIEKNIHTTILRLVYCVEHKATIIFQKNNPIAQSLIFKLSTLKVATRKTKRYLPFTRHCTYHSSGTFPLVTQFRFQQKPVFAKLTTCHISRTKQNYTKPLPDSASTLKIKVMLCWK